MTRIAGPLLFKNSLTDLFFIIKDTDIASYADDNTPYVVLIVQMELLSYQKKPQKFLFKWFNDNLIKNNADKCYLLVSTNNTVKIKIENFDITNNKVRNYQELNLTLNFDFKLNSLSIIKKLEKLEKLEKFMHCQEQHRI